MLSASATSTPTDSRAAPVLINAQPARSFTHVQVWQCRELGCREALLH